MRSIQARLLVGTMAGTTIILCVSGIILYVLSRSALLREFDDALGAKARLLATLVEQERRGPEMELDARTMPEFVRTDRPEYVEVWDARDNVVQRSDSLRGADLASSAGTLDRPDCRTVRLPDGRAGRQAGIVFHPRWADEEEERGLTSRSPAPRATLVFARETAAMDRTLSRLRWLICSIGVVAMLTSAGVLIWVVRGGLRPLRVLAARIHEIGAADLSSRVDIPNSPAEVLPVVQRLNELLQRLEAAFEREKSFAADVAHELRTPLAGLRTTLEVAASRPREEAAYRSAINDSLAIACQMQTMVDNLLSLVRIEGGQVQVAPEMFNPAGLLRECWAPLAGKAEERGLHVAWNTDACQEVSTDKEKLRQVLRNVLENAVTYCDAGGHVRIEASADQSGRIVIQVANSGSQLSEAEAARVFDRFWRGDKARHASGLHCGLGLSLCKRIVALLGGDIRAECAGGTFLLKLTLGMPGRFPRQ